MTISQHRESKDPEPLYVTAKEVGGILTDCGVDEQQIAAFCESCTRQFGDGAVLSPANLIDSSRFEIKTRAVTVSIEPESSYLAETRVIDGKKYLLIPVGESFEVNGLTVG